MRFRLTLAVPLARRGPSFAFAFPVIVLLASILLASFSPASALVRIGDDRGGQIGPYLNQFAAVRDSGETVMIDGACLSACTLVLGTVPRDRICVTPRARLGFHAAWDVASTGQPVVSVAGTRLLWEVYPRNVRQWITRKGGLTPRMIYLRGRELARMYPLCH